MLSRWPGAAGGQWSVWSSVPGPLSVRKGGQVDPLPGQAPGHRGWQPRSLKTGAWSCGHLGLLWRGPGQVPQPPQLGTGVPPALPCPRCRTHCGRSQPVSSPPRSGDPKDLPADTPHPPVRTGPPRRCAEAAASRCWTSGLDRPVSLCRSAPEKCRTSFAAFSLAGIRRNQESDGAHRR